MRKQINWRCTVCPLVLSVFLLLAGCTMPGGGAHTPAYSTSPEQTYASDAGTQPDEDGGDTEGTQPVTDSTSATTPDRTSAQPTEAGGSKTDTVAGPEGETTAPEEIAYPIETTAPSTEPLEISMVSHTELFQAEDGTPLLQMDIKIPHIKNEQENLSIEYINDFFERLRINYIYDVHNRLLPLAREALAQSLAPAGSGDGEQAEQDEQDEENTDTQTAGVPSFLTFGAAFSARVTYNTGGYLSVVWDLWESTGGERSPSGRASNLFDINTGKPITLWMLFKDAEEKVRPLLLDELLRQARAVAGSGDSVLSADYEQKIPLYFDPKNVYVDDDALVVFFQLNTVAPSLHDFYELRIPLERLSSSLNDAFAQSV